MSLTLSEIRASFDGATFLRGMGYARDGRVLSLDLSAAGADAPHIDAQVKGTLSIPYAVRLMLIRGRHGTIVKGACDCPIGFNCKHAAAAAIIAAEAIASGARGAPAAFDPADGAVAAWLERLERAAGNSETAASPAQQLHYVVGVREIGAVPRLELSAIVTATLKSGDLGARRNVELYGLAHSTAAYVEPADRTIGRLAVAAGVISQPGELAPKLVAALLEMAIATGRLHWQHVKNPALQRHALAGEQKFDWRLDADGRQRATLASLPHARLLPSDPLWYVDAESARAGPLDAGVDAALAALLAESPSLNAAQARRVHTRWHRAFANGLVPAPHSDVRTEVLETNPAPRLRLSRFEWPKNAPATMEPLAAIAELSFAYGEREVRPSDAVAEFQQVTGDRVSIWPRRYAFERAALETLGHEGLIPIYWPHLQFVDRQSAVLRFPGAGDHRWAHFLDTIVPQLKAQGWQIDVDADFPYEVVHADEWDAEIVESENHWFELDLGVDVGGERISLLPIVVDALRASGIRSATQLADLGDEARVYGRLPNGRFVALPPRRVERIVETLVELFDVPLSKEGRLALTPGHLASVERLDESAPVRWSAAASLRTVVRDLADAAAIEPVAPPATFKGELRPYQAHGVAWLQTLARNGFGGVLADDMGLGKTVQLLAHVAIEKNQRRLRSPVLIVAPTSVIPNWRAEIARFVPHLRVLCLTGANRAQHFESIGEHDLVLTSYALLHRDAPHLIEREWQIVVLDEAQFIKNPRSKGAQAAMRLRAGQRLALTGTPMENHLEELWSIFSFAVPGLLGDRTAFGRVFRTPIEKRGDASRRAVLASRLRPFLLRRTKAAVAVELPEKTEIVTRVEIGGAQRDLYETIRLAMHERVRAELARRGLARSRIVVLDALLKLRQVCCDPRLVKIPAARGVHESGKLEALFDMLPELIEEGRRVLLFSQFTSMLDLVKPELMRREIPFVELRGDTKDRVTPVERFQSGEVPLFLISLKAGGTGLNLTAADTVIHYDPWWNPAVERQATDRAHRIGQHRPVFVYKLITAGTVEERILDLQARKGELAAGIFDEAAAIANLTPAEIDRLFAPL